MKKIVVTSDTGHFGKVLGYDDRYTYNFPPPSTIIGMLQVIYNQDIDNFIFGYTFQSDLKFRDDILIHKRNTVGKTMQNSRAMTNIHFIELLYNCKLNIYTDIEDSIQINYMLSMGRAGNIARVHLPIPEIELSNTVGQGLNQYTDKSIGNGKISSINMMSKYNEKFQSYDNQINFIRFNKVFNYSKNYDIEEGQNIFLWQVKDGEVMPYDD